MMSLRAAVQSAAAEIERLYTDLHRHPELSFAEFRTARIVAERLREMGLEVRTGIAGTGVVGSLDNGSGPVVALRADMDGLPVLEETGLDYASTDQAVDRQGATVPVMHACGHDVHVSCLLGATQVLASRKADWSGTLIVVFQPAEEEGGGAQAMVDDDVFAGLPRPHIVLGQHVAPVAAGFVGAHPGEAFAAADSFDVHLFGRGGHGSRPETTIDPVVLAAATVLRLQTIVSREIAGHDTAVVTVGQIHSGSKNNIIPDEATLGLSIRSTTETVRASVLQAVRRVIAAEAAASGADREPQVIARESFPVLVNDPTATERTIGVFQSQFGEGKVLDPGPVTGSEDVGILATAAGAPLVYWLLGGIDPGVYATAVAAGTTDRDIPSNHSPFFAPVLHPTLETGVEALVVAALEWLDTRGDAASP